MWRKKEKVMAKKIKNAIQKMGDWILNAWDVSKMYITGSLFALVLFVAIISAVILFVTGYADCYPELHGYALVGTCFGGLLAVPLGFLVHFCDEEY